MRASHKERLPPQNAAIVCFHSGNLAFRIMLATVFVIALTTAASSCRRSATGGHNLTPNTSNNILRVSLNTNSVHVGDVVTLTIRVLHAKGAGVHIPPLLCQSNLVVREHRIHSSRVTSTLEETSEKYSFVPFYIGEFPLMTGCVTISTSPSNTISVPVPPISLSVSSILKGTNNTFRDIKPPRPWPTHRHLTIILVLLALLLGCGLLIAFLLFRKKAAQPSIAPAPRPPPHRLALEQLDHLRTLGLIEKGDCDQFFVILTNIVRHYVENRFGLRAPELTTEEFINQAAHSNVISPQHQTLIQHFLEESDLVKFARQRVSSHVMRAALDAAERLVKETSPDETVNHEKGRTDSEGA